MRTLTTEHMKADEFRAALEQAEFGDRITYAVGELGRSVDLARAGSVHALQEAAMAAWYDGRVHLVQRKVGLKLFQYIAVKCHGPKRQRPVWRDDEGEPCQSKKTSEPSPRAIRRQDQNETPPQRKPKTKPMTVETETTKSSPDSIALGVTPAAT